MAILTVVSWMTRVEPAIAQIAPVNFDAMDDYMSTRMKDLGIPGAALVLVQGDQIVHRKSVGLLFRPRLTRIPPMRGWGLRLLQGGDG